MSDPLQTEAAEFEQRVSESAPDSVERRVLGDHLGVEDEAGPAIVANDQGLLPVGGDTTGQTVAGRGREGAPKKERGREKHDSDAG